MDMLINKVRSCNCFEFFKHVVSKAGTVTDNRYRQIKVSWYELNNIIMDMRFQQALVMYFVIKFVLLKSYIFFAGFVTCFPVSFTYNTVQDECLIFHSLESFLCLKQNYSFYKFKIV